MKTQLLNLALGLFTYGALSSVAMADPSASRAFLPGPSKASSSVQANPVLNVHCKADACCGTKTLATATGGGRAARADFKNVVTCKKTCSIEAKQQHPVCRKGMRA